MSASPADLSNLMASMQKDLTVLKTNLAEAQRMLASINLTEPSKYRCDKCAGGLDLPSPQHLRDHLELIHGEAA